jgi:hypothetical protein
VLVFWPHSGQNHLCVYRCCKQGFHYSEHSQKTLHWVKDRRFWFPVSRPDDRAIPSRRTSDPYSIRPDDVPYSPDASKTKHYPFGRRALPSGPSTVSRSFYPTCMRPDVSAARPDASRYSTSLRFFPSSDKGKIDQPSGRCSIPSGHTSP